MDIAQFLERVVAPGNYLAVCYTARHGGLSTKFFPRDEAASAAGLIRWASHKKHTDVWYAPASFREAVADGVDNFNRPKYKGERSQANAHQVKAFWTDLDIANPGAHKNDARVFPDLSAAVMWLRAFAQTTGLPLPNIWLSSGYGLHVYWVLEDAMDAASWRPYAEAFKAALVACNATTDVGLTSDSARLLRPPGAFNYKDKKAPKPTGIIKVLAGDYPNQTVLDKLKPYLGQAPSAHYGNNSLVGTPPAALAARAAVAPATAAAKANMPSRRPHHFAAIAEKCAQVKLSLDANGANDSRDLWYLGHLSLAHFCVDGRQYAHEISKGHPGYLPTVSQPPRLSVDDALSQIAAEQARKGTGAPSCATYDTYGVRGVCHGCPYWGRITSPYTLGVEGDGDLPDNYRRQDGVIEHMVDTRDGPRWVPIIEGDVYGPALDLVGGSYRLSFTYERAKRKFSVVVERALPVDAGRIIQYFNDMGLTLYEGQAKPWREFIVAWINKLRDLRAERAQAVPPFGWAMKPDNTYAGFSVAGTLYRPDGTSEPAPGGDVKITDMFQPAGTLKAWKAAAELVVGGRPDLQTIVAAAFGAPLVEFTGQSGVVMSAFSTGSGVGKSSALQVGTAVWSSPAAMFAFRDTVNSIAYRIGKTRVMPSYWDEVPVDKETAKDIVDILFTLGQGKEKARLNSDSTLKESGSWQTILVCAGNNPLMDHVEHLRSNTTAGAVRLFEFAVSNQQPDHDPASSLMIAGTARNYGHAGRVYAGWLAANTGVAQTMVKGMMDNLAKRLKPLNEERFYIAGMACVLMGAHFAEALGLVPFDVPSMFTFLADAFDKLRDRRRRNLPVGTDGLDIETIFSDFYSDHSADRLVTNRFKPRGIVKAGTIKIVSAPRRVVCRLAVHTSQLEAEMRIDKNIWQAWCRDKGFPAGELLHLMSLRWGAKEAKGLMGAGTPYRTGNVFYIALDLNVPELAHYNDSYDSTGGAPGLSQGGQQ